MATRRRWMCLVIAMALLALPAWVLAQQPGEPVPVEPVVVELAANESVETPIYGFCLEYGDPFPGAALQPGELAQDEVRTAIAYAVLKDYVQTETWQTQLAVWFFANGNVKVPETHTAVADEIIAAGQTYAPPVEAVAGAQLLTEALAGNVITATIDDFQNDSPSGIYFGSGTLLLTNLTAQPIRILLPYGTQFAEEPDRGRQMMAIFPQEEAAPQPTPTPTATPEPELPPTGGVLAPEIPAVFAALAGAGALLVVLVRRRR